MIDGWWKTDRKESMIKILGGKIMKKRVQLMAMVLCTLMVTILLAGCSNSDKITIGISQFADHPSLDNCRNGFIEGLKQEGYEEGKNVTFDYQNAQTDMGIANQIASNFVSKKYNLICGIATPAAQAAFNAAEANKIPVIYSAISDPVGAQLATADGTSGKSVTGTSDQLPVEKQLAMIREFLPKATKIGILYSTSEVNSQTQIAEFKKLAPKYNFEIVEGGVNAAADIPLAVDAMLSKVDCINNLTDNLVVSSLATILDKAGAKKIPVFGSEIEQVKNGCLASESIDYFALGIQTGKMAARVLKGEDITKMKYEIIKDSAVVVNSTVLKDLGMTLPAAYEGKVELVE